LRVSPETAINANDIKKSIAKLKGWKQEKILDMRVLRRSIDARQKDVKINLLVKIAYGDDSKIQPEYKHIVFQPLAKDAPVLIIVGAGPAGLFAALKAIELGIKPIVIERGRDVDTRRVDIASITKTGKLDPDSNYCFGEGGAGAFSDGKLFTRSKKRGNVSSILQLLHQHGANESILIDSHPHIGSDRLPVIIKNIRNTIINCGGEVLFNTRVNKLLIEDKEAIGIQTSDGKVYKGPVILATGHSARDIYRELDAKGVKIEPKSLAMGVRLEHPQSLIDQLQYHNKKGRGKYLPAAEYNFVTQINGRGVYSFCMCPGGVIVPSMSSPEESVVNGMSASARASQWANSGMVVEVRPGDIKGLKEGPLEMLELQEMLEKKFYEESGETYNAPAQRMTDFVKGIASEGQLPRSSYPNGIHNARIDKLLPEEISNRLQQGFKVFDSKCKGFLTDQALLIGLESRTSSPVRIPRDKDTLEHIEIKNLYPAGEGAGYAGGIVSAAIDGQRCVEAYFNKIKNKNNGNNN
ncbi:MAG: FAD-binding protein, partial [Muribaculaceae bacterium]|nr:FAD-binding protein [Muribaculaceae bacterium]